MSSSSTEEVNRLTENTYKNVMEQFNPGLRNLAALGRNYEKAASAMVLAGKAYYDAVAKIGELALASPVSKELGFVLVEISDAHKRLNHDLEESFRRFHKEIISEVERKTDLDVKYMTATLKRYQIEHRSKLDSLEKSQTELKKLRRKSQGSKNATKYENKEMEYVETITSHQSEIQKFIAEGCRDALLEEKRRFCFLVDKHCSYSLHMSSYHDKAKEFLNSKLPNWQELCSDATKVPDTVTTMIQKVKTPSSTPISGTPQPSPMVERSSRINSSVYESTVQNTRPPPAPNARAITSPLVDMFNNPPDSQKRSSESLNSLPHNSSFGKLQNSVSVATGLNLMNQPKVKTIFPHTAGSNKTLMSFDEGDTITLLIPEEKDGWLYGEHDTTKMRGWFPSSYSRPFVEQDKNNRQSLASARSVSTTNLTERGEVFLPPPDYLDSSLDKDTSENTDEGQYSFKSSTSRPLPPKPNTAAPTPVMNGIMKPPFLGNGNPFTTVKLRPTVTNDRSAPMI